MLVGCGIKEME
jgi:hypothetical protein